MIDIRNGGCHFADREEEHANCPINEIELERLNDNGWKHHYAIRSLHMIHDGIRVLMK